MKGPRYLAQDILADHLGSPPDRPIVMEYRSHGPARWEQGKPWRTSSSEIDVFLSQDHVQQKLAEQREGDEMEREIRELERQEHPQRDEP